MTAAVEKFRVLIGNISPRRYFFLAAVFVFIVFFIGLGSRHLSGGDEPRVAGIAAETALLGNWLEPGLNGRPFLEKPPLYFWADALSFNLFGHTDFAAKFPSAVASFFGVLAIFALARGMGMSGLGAMLSSVMLATSAQYWRYSRKCMIDIFLAVFIAFAMWAFWEICRSEKLKNKLGWYLLFCLALGGAVFSKSFVGLAIPSSALFFWLAIDDFYIKKKFSWQSWFFLFSGAALSFIPIATWVFLLYLHSGYDAVYTVVWTNNFGRFFGFHAEHVSPFYYYFLKLPEQLQPWTVLLPFAIWFHVRRFWKEKSSMSLFMLCWLFIPYLMLTMSAGKRQVYVLPLYAAETLMIGSMVADLLTGKFKLPEKFDYVNLAVKILSSVLCIAMIGAGIAFFIVGLVVKLSVMAYVSSMIMLVAGLWMLAAMLRGQVRRASFAFLVGLAFTYVSIDTVIFAAQNGRKSYHPLFDYCENLLNKGNDLRLYRPIERISGGAVFYLDRKLPEYRDGEKLAPGKTVYLLCGDDEDIKPLLAAGFKKVKRFKIRRDYYWVLNNEG
ncbi:MAG: glycosyltransferase family 39 protein [Lentisphaerae bacterium]|nr:glycosyltransferase family 39 protein [Lentisphaerota bacterium]MCP4101484.1 glycosyltransferase family 39 protein [Lentisphaerota bacterium]